MSKKIVRLNLEISGYDQTFAADHPFKLIHCAEPRDGSPGLDVWFEINQYDYLRKVDFSGYYPHEASYSVYGTGDILADDYEHQVTVVMHGGLVWHVYKSN